MTKSFNAMSTGLLVGALVLGAGGGLAASAVYHHTSNGNNDHVATAVAATSAGVGGDVESVATKVLPSVVKIEVEGKPDASGQAEAGTGSGIIVSSTGEIVTNNHVADIAANGGKMRIDFNNGTTATGTVVGLDPSTDLAVVKAQGVAGLTPATIGSSTDLKVGQEVVAVGAPLGLSATVTNGIISATNRPVDVGTEVSNDTSDVVYPALQTDAAINPGNSGGALVNLAGQVVGISSAGLGIPNPSDPSAQTGSIGLGFAIPISDAMPIVDQIIAGQTPTHAQLGIELPKNSGEASSTLFAPLGAKIPAMVPGGPAAKAGIVAGDTITKIDGQAVNDPDSLIAAIHSYRPGDTVMVTWTHGTTTHTANITLGSDTTQK